MEGLLFGDVSDIFNELARMRSLLVLVLVLVCLLASAQVDSLVKVLATLPNDTSRLPVLTDILRATTNVPDKALEYAAQYTELAMPVAARSNKRKRRISQAC